jgi:hypothetical protein
VLVIVLNAVFAWLQALFGTASPGPVEIAILAVFPIVVWGSDELRKWFLRSRGRENY